MGMQRTARTRRRRLVAGLMSLTLALLVGVAVFSYLAYRRAASDLVMQRDRQVAYLSAARLKEEMNRYADVLWSVARSPEVYRAEPIGQRAALARARHRLTIFDGGVVLMDHFGNVAAAEPERAGILGADWSDRDFFRELLASRGAYFSDAADDGPGDTAAVVVSVPVIGENNEFLGVLAGMFRLGTSSTSAFYASILRLRLGQSGDTLVVDGNGRVLYDASYRRVGHLWDLGAIPGYSDAGGAARLRDPDDGADLIVAYAPVPGTRWTLVSEDDWAAATQPVQRYARWLLIAMALATVLPTAGLLLLLREAETSSAEQEQRRQRAWASDLIRQRLIPRQVPLLPGWSLAVDYQPAGEANGDFYDFLLTPDGGLMVALGDMAPAGLPAAHLLATARATFRAAARRALRPAEALNLSNSLICPEAPGDACLTSLYGLLDPHEGRLAFANAGFNEPLYRAGGQAVALGAGGEPLGASPEADYEGTEIVLAPGEAVVLYSDGVTRARNAAGEAFGAARLRAIVAGQDGDARALVEAIAGALREFTGAGWAPEDDVTILAIERDRNGRPAAGQG